MISGCCCRGLSLRGCEDIDDAAVLTLSKYTAPTHQHLLQRFSSLDVASSSTSDDAQPAADNSSKAAVMPSYRNVSLQRTLLGNTLLGMRKAAAPRNPHQQPVLDLEAGGEHTQGSSSAHCEPQRSPMQHRSMHTGKPCCHCAC